MSLPAGVHPTLANWIGETKGYYAISRLIKHNNGRVPPLFRHMFLIGMFSRNILNQCPFYMSLLFIPTFYHEDQYFMEIWKWICKVSDPYHELGLLANFSKYDFLFENAFQKLKSPNDFILIFLRKDMKKVAKITFWRLFSFLTIVPL